MSRGWAKASACRFQMTLSCAVQVVSPPLGWSPLSSFLVIGSPQGLSKRSGWSGHGRTNNRAGNFLFYFFILITFFFKYFLSGIIIEPGIVSILFLKQRRHSYQNVHSDDSSLGRFRPSHAIASRQSSSFDGWERPPGARVRWPLQRPSMRRRDYRGGSYIHVCSSDWTYRYL